MLNVCVVSSAAGTTIMLYGALEGPKVDELERCWEILRVICRDRPICVEFKCPVRVGHRGEELLAMMRRDGVVVIERDLKRPLARPVAVVRRF